MNNFSIEIKFKKNRETKRIEVDTRKSLKKNLVTIMLISLLMLTPILFFPASARRYEPSIETIFNNLGFTNIIPQDIETFSPGAYNITLLAEFSSYNSINVLSYYIIETEDYQTIFSGLEGATSHSGGYTIPQLSKIFDVKNQFGLSMVSSKYRYFTENILNPDFPEKHVKVYVNLDDPSMFLIGFKNCLGRGIRRYYNDMVFSMKRITPQIINVTRSCEIPNYDQPVTIKAQVSKKNYINNSIILSYQIGSENWSNLTMIKKEGVYISEIPAQKYNTMVNYKVYVFDKNGNIDTSEIYSYTVGDSVSPIISKIIQIPTSLNNENAIKVTAMIFEPLNASGVKNVTLEYTNNITCKILNMTKQNDVWTAIIPKLNEGNFGKFFIEAYDTAENSIKTTNFSYLTINLDQSPILLLNYLPPTVYTNEAIEFDASGSFDPDGHITSYSWDFGDGTTAKEAVTSHVYSDDGRYRVTINIIDNDGIETSKTVFQIVKNRAPIAKLIESSILINKNDEILFNASSSYDPDGIIIDYKWDFGDGNTDNGKTVSHTFTNNGFYTIQLTVIDNDGGKDSTYVTKYIVKNQPFASFKTTIETESNIKKVNFDASESYDPDGTIINYTWDFGDGNTTTGITTNHTYHKEKTYIVTLTVTDDDGDTNTISKRIIIDINKNPTALFIESRKTVYSNEIIHFNGSKSFDSDGSIISYEWDFGEGSTAFGVKADHEYNDNGNYTVTLKVIDDYGANDSFNKTIKVLNRFPVASFTKTVTNVTLEETIYFDASESYDPDGTIINYTWDFGDGNTTTGITTNHTYHKEKTYIVTLTVTDDDGAMSSEFVEISAESESIISLSIISIMGLSITTLTATLLYGLFVRKNKKNKL